MEQMAAPFTPLGRRERKKMETRQTIRRAALTLALELGTERLTVEAITEAADVSPRTFFNYFVCKEDALVTDVSAAAAGLVSRISDRPAHESPLQVLRSVIMENDQVSLVHGGVPGGRDQARARQRLVQENPSLMSRQLAQYWSLERAVAEALARRLDVDPDQDLRPALLASVAVSVVRVALQRWTTGGPESLAELLSSAFDLLEDGALTDPLRSPSPDGYRPVHRRAAEPLAHRLPGNNDV